MEKIIQQIATKLVEEVLETLREDGLSSIGGVAQQLANTVKSTVLEIIGAAIQQMDQALVDASKERKKDGLRIKERNVARTILTELGELHYQRTYFETAKGERCYLLDQLIGVEAYERLTKELCAELVQGAADMSMQKAAKSLGAAVSRQTVNNKVLALKEVAVHAVRVKQTPKELHLFADEDHVHLKNGRSAIVPLVTVTEGIDATEKRHKTVNAVHFEGYGMENQSMFENITSFLYERYDMERVERIYVHADGGRWIREVKNCLPDAILVMDGFHLEKRLRQISRLHGAVPYMRGIRIAILENSLDKFRSCCDRIGVMQDERGRMLLAEHSSFIRNHWHAIVKRMQNEVCGSCTEPLVSHVLSARLSRNPLAWSEHGLRKMAMLRVYVKNGGVVTAKDIRVSRSEDDLQHEKSAFKHGFEKYRRYADKQIGDSLGFKLDWSVFDHEHPRTGKLDGTRMLLNAYGRLRDSVASA